MEQTILRRLKFELTVPTQWTFLVRFLKVARATDRQHHRAQYYLERCLQEHDGLSFRPSMLAAAAVFLARIPEAGLEDAWVRRCLARFVAVCTTRVCLRYSTHVPLFVYLCRRVVPSVCACHASFFVLVWARSTTTAFWVVGVLFLRLAAALNLTFRSFPPPPILPRCWRRPLPPPAFPVGRARQVLQHPAGGARVLRPHDHQIPPGRAGDGLPAAPGGGQEEVPRGAVPGGGHRRTPRAAPQAPHRRQRKLKQKSKRRGVYLLARARFLFYHFCSAGDGTLGRITPRRPRPGSSLVGHGQGLHACSSGAGAGGRMLGLRGFRCVLKAPTATMIRTVFFWA